MDQICVLSWMKGKSLVQAKGFAEFNERSFLWLHPAKGVHVTRSQFNEVLERNPEIISYNLLFSNNEKKVTIVLQ